MLKMTIEDYRELRNPKVNRQIEGSNADIRADRVKPATALLATSRRGLKHATSKDRRDKQK